MRDGTYFIPALKLLYMGSGMVRLPGRDAFLPGTIRGVATGRAVSHPPKIFKNWENSVTSGKICGC